MAWTTPRTWTTGEIVTAAMMNTDHRDNLNAISAHRHSGNAGDGAAILPPRWTADQRVPWVFAVPGLPSAATSTEFTPGDVIVTLGGGTGQFGPFAYDTTYNLFYLPFQTGALSGNLVTVETAIGTSSYASGIAPISTELLPYLTCYACMSGTLTTSVCRIGLFDTAYTRTAATGNPTSAIFFRSTNGGNWFAVTRTGGVETASDTTIANVADTFREFFIKMTTPTTVEFYIDNVLRATHTINIPAVTVQLHVLMAVETSSAAARILRLGTHFGLSYLGRAA